MKLVRNSGNERVIDAIRTLRSDSFEEFYQARKCALLALVSQALGKALAPMLDSDAEDLTGEEEEDDEDSLAPVA